MSKMIDSYENAFDKAMEESYKLKEMRSKTQAEKLRALRDEFGYRKDAKRVKSEEEQDGQDQ